MSQENVDLLRAFAEADVVARAAGEFDAEAAIARQAELWDPDIELDASEFPVLDISGVHRGADAARNWWREWYAAWDTLRFEYELVDAGDRVVMLLDLSASRALDGHRVSACQGRVGVYVQGRVDSPHEALHEPGGSPRSRGAVGVARAEPRVPPFAK